MESALAAEIVYSRFEFKETEPVRELCSIKYLGPTHKPHLKQWRLTTRQGLQSDPGILAVFWPVDVPCQAKDNGGENVYSKSRR